MLSTYVWVMFAIFLLVMFVLSFYATKKTKTMEDFAISGAKLGPYVLGLSLAATLFSAATFMGYPGYSYAWGFSNLWLYLSLAVAAPIGIITIAKAVRKRNETQKSLSLPDWLGDFYDSDFLRVGTGLIMLFNLFYIAAQFTAGAQIFEYMLDLNYSTGLIIIALIVVAYVFAGGSFADVYTDAVQAVLMVIAGVFVFITGIYFFGNGNIHTAFTNISENLAAQDGKLIQVINPESNYYAVSAVIGLMIVQFAFAAQPQLFNKVLSLEKQKDLRKMIIVYIVASVTSLLVLFGGLYARAALPNVEVDDLALIEYITWGLPGIIAAFIVVVILAAALSTTDGLFVVMSTVFANDIFRKVLVKRGIVKVSDDKVDKIALRISRLAVLVVGILASLLVLSPPPFLGDLMWVGISGVSAGTLGPIIYAIFGKKKASPHAAEGSMIIGLIFYLIIILTGLKTSPLAAGGWATLIGIIVMWILAYTFKRPEKEQTETK